MIYVMSGGGTKLFAAIGVKFSAGSTMTCTCKENGKVLTAKTTSDQTDYVFAVPNAGTWTVADVTKGKSKEVSITKPGQNEVVNLAQHYIFQNGNGFVNGFTAKLWTYAGGSNGSIDITDADSIKITTTSFPFVMIQQNLNTLVSEYSVASMRMKQTSGTKGVAFGALSNLRNQSDTTKQGTLSNSQAEVASDTSKNNNIITISFPLDNVKAPAYLAANWNGCQGEIYDIWLE